MTRATFRLPRTAPVVDPAVLVPPFAGPSVRWAMVLSVLAHIAVIVLVTFDDLLPEHLLPPELEVVLVNSKDDVKPDDPLRRAQTNLNGGGNTDEDRVLKTPLGSVNDELARQASETEQRVARLEGEAKALMERINSEQQVQQQRLGVASSTANANDSSPQPKVTVPLSSAAPSDQAHGTDPNAEGSAFARQAAEISRNYDAYQKRPRRKQIGARTVAYIFARYEDDYRTRVERVGTVNYPAPHNGQPVYGKVRLTVSVKSDGTIEKIALNASSGDPYLDQQAADIVRMSAPFGRFTPEMRKEADVLDITRTFTFTRLSDGMHSE